MSPIRPIAGAAVSARYITTNQYLCLFICTRAWLRTTTVTIVDTNTQHLTICSRMTAVGVEVLHAYRHLTRAALRAVQYATPAHYVVRKHVRDAFRASSAADFDREKIARTLEFLRTAAKTRGVEHRVIRNIVRVWGEKNIQRYTST